MPVWLAIIFGVVGGGLLSLISLKLLQILQLSSYRARGIFKWLKRTSYDFVVRYFALAFFCFTSMFVYVMCFGKTGWLSQLGYFFFFILSFYFVIAVAREPQKTPLKFTGRIKRLLVMEFIIGSGVTFCLIWFLRNTVIMYSLAGITPLLVIPIVLAAHYIMLPLEKLIGRSYISKAKKKLAASSPIIIGITGSYGKTTAKKILATMLWNTHKPFASPNSYNTPMGLCKCINEEYRGEKIFIAEMGARFIGDIAYLKKLFAPSYTMLTSIGNMHLETFGSLENIISEKISILDGAKFAVANGDCELIRENAKNAVLCGKDYDTGYRDVKSDIHGTSFVLRIEGNEYNVHTKLLGEHIPSTIALCARMAHELGVSDDEIVSACENLPFVEHRLEVMDSGSVLILDDSFNSNPSGANSALSILATYEGVKVAITPGFVELGSDTEKCNRELGEKLASVCDYVFLLGPNAEIIKSGMGEFGNVEVVDSLEKAMAKLRELTPPMAVLFENDLPDNY